MIKKHVYLIIITLNENETRDNSKPFLYILSNSDTMWQADTGVRAWINEKTKYIEKASSYYAVVI